MTQEKLDAMRQGCTIPPKIYDPALAAAEGAARRRAMASGWERLKPIIVTPVDAATRVDGDQQRDDAPTNVWYKVHSFACFAVCCYVCVYCD
jgi:hypothetical protein